MEVYAKYDVPDEVIPEIKNKYAGEKSTDLEVDKANSSTSPYYAFGDPRATPEKFTFKGADYLVYRTSPGVKVNWCYDHM